MPYTEAHKRETRERIVQSARRLFNRRGFSEVSIDEIMEHAGLTRGGFYNHFPTKEDLYVEAVTAIMRSHPARDWEGIEVDFDALPPRLSAQIVNAYLSREHLADVDGSCPLIALPSDVTRGGDKLKAAYRQVLGAMIAVFTEGVAASDGERRHRAIQVATLCVGGMVLARAVGEETLAEEIRQAARSLAFATGGLEEA